MKSIPVPGAALVVLAALAGPARLGGAEGEAAESAFKEQIRPLVARYCHGCHDAEKKKGGLDLARFTTTGEVLEEFEIWKTAVGRINVHEMPPRASPQLRHEEMARIDRWFNSLPRPRTDCRELASDANQRWYRGFVMSRRLTHAEYDNTTRDLLGLDLKPARAFPSDGAGGEGFDTAGNTLYSSPILLEKYLQAAEDLLGAVFAGEGPSASPEARAALERLVVARPGPELAPRDAAGRVVAAFARRAFRRPVADEEVERLLGLFDGAQARGASFEEALRLPLKAVLVSPHFLFFAEPEPEAAGIYRLDAHQLASRLSYFLWSSMPDEELTLLAGQGRLHEPEVLRGQVRRMLRDPRARALGENFALQWLGLEPLGGTVRPDPQLFPEFDEALAASMREEVVRFFNDLVASDRSLLELIDARETFADERLARHYGLAGVEGPGMRRVALPDRRRGGVLGMAAVQVVTSYPARSSPVLRGKWVLETLLGARVPLPPAALSLAEAAPGGRPLTLRQRLEEHRTNPECASCHDRMDPLGFGLENFDAAGRWRDEDGGQPVDSSGKLPSGEVFQGPAGLKDLLLARQEEVLRHFVRKLLGYALGRELNKFDQCVIDDALKALHAAEHRAGAVFEAIALSYPFGHRYAKK